MAENKWYWHLGILKNIDVKLEVFIAFSVALRKSPGALIYHSAQNINTQTFFFWNVYSNK